MNGRWHGDTYVVGGSVVGTVSQGANGNWWAYGCMEDWEDTQLRADITREEAKLVVENWVEMQQ